MGEIIQKVSLPTSGELAELTAALIDIPSESHNEKVLADAVEQALKSAEHLSVHRIGHNVIATNHNAHGVRVILAGHLDTVPANNNLPSRIDGGRVFGLGACDMKGGVAVALHLATQVASPSVDVTYIFYEAEEVAAEFNGLGRLAREAPEFLAADFAVLMEPSNANVEAGCQGTIRVQVSTHGERAHSARSWMGRNAIHQAREILGILESYEPARIVIDGLEYREGLNAVGIEGGVAGNVIPDRCVVTINYRFAPDKSVEQAIDHVVNLFSDFDVEVTDQAPGATPGLSQQIAQDFLRATGALVAPKFGWTDVARFAEMKTPAVNYGPGDPSLAHSQGEFVSIDEVNQVAQTLEAWLTRAL